MSDIGITYKFLYKLSLYSEIPAVYINMIERKHGQELKWKLFGCRPGEVGLGTYYRTRLLGTEVSYRSHTGSTKFWGFGAVRPHWP